MKKSGKKLVILAVALAVAAALAFVIFSLAGCDNGSVEENGLVGTTWGGPSFSYDGGPNGYGEYRLSFTSADFLMLRWDDHYIIRGTYTVSGSTITFTTTEQWNERGEAWNPATGSYLPQTATFTDTTMTIVFGTEPVLTYTKQ